MIDKHVNNPKSPKYYIKKYLLANREYFKGRTVIDLPAGNGTTTELLLEVGSMVEPFDLFPEYFMLKNIACRRADIAEKIPVEDAHADAVICQEGIEHFSDQLKALKEFNRVLKKGGRLLLTTPSYSNLKAKLSYLLFECEYFHKLMPPNEIDSIWMSDTSITSEMYHGHIFLSGIQKLRLLGKLAGFSIAEVPFMRVNKTSLALFPLLFPIIVISSYITRWRSMRKNRGVPDAIKAAVYNEQLALNVSPRILLDEHLFIVFEKSRELGEVTFNAGGVFKQFTAIM